ncbi:MAG: hypothetical protein AAF318_08570 [Pseudomonadota bacterium]
MRALLAVAVLMVAGGLFWAFFATAWDSLRNLPSRDALQDASAEVADIVSAPAPEPEPVAEPATVRFVEEDGIVGVRIEGPLTRLPAIEKPAEPPPPPKEEPVVYRLVVIESAGVIDTRTDKVRLAHINAPEPGATCERADGSAWPCGVRARTALRRLVRRRAIGCLDLKDRAADAPVREAVCTVGNTDMAEWMVANGWAEPADTAPELWRDLHATAKEEGRGLYNAAGR